MLKKIVLYYKQIYEWNIIFRTYEKQLLKCLKNKIKLFIKTDIKFSSLYYGTYLTFSINKVTICKWNVCVMYVDLNPFILLLNTS